MSVAEQVFHFVIMYSKLLRFSLYTMRFAVCLASLSAWETAILLPLESGDLFSKILDASHIKLVEVEETRTREFGVNMKAL